MSGFIPKTDAGDALPSFGYQTRAQHARCTASQAFAQALIHFTGQDAIDPPIVFPAPTAPVVTFSSWSEMSHMCGDSRVWGGLHFEVSVAVLLSLVLTFVVVSPWWGGRRTAFAVISESAVRRAESVQHSSFGPRGVCLDW